jgi:glutathione S-transferase
VLLLELDPAAVAGPLRADAIPSGELFPHLYGPLRLEAVRSVVTIPAAT